MQDENPFASPTTVTEPNRELVPPPETPRLRPLAIVVGCLTDIGLTFALGIGLGIVVVIYLLSQGAILADMEAAFAESIWLNVLMGMMGLCCTMTGGYVAARMAGAWPLRHAAGAGILTNCFGVITTLAMPDSQPMWATVAALILTIPAAMLGGYLRLRGMRRTVVAA